MAQHSELDKRQIQEAYTDLLKSIKHKLTDENLQLIQKKHLTLPTAHMKVYEEDRENHTSPTCSCNNCHKRNRVRNKIDCLFNPSRRGLKTQLYAY